MPSTGNHTRDIPVGVGFFAGFRSGLPKSARHDIAPITLWTCGIVHSRQMITVPAVTGRVTAQYIQNWSDAAQPSSPKVKNVVENRDCQCPLSAPRMQIRPKASGHNHSGCLETYGNKCPREEEHGQKRNGFHDLVILIRNHVVCLSYRGQLVQYFGAGFRHRLVFVEDQKRLWGMRPLTRSTSFFSRF
jgi:hypothetical protein